MKSTLKFRIISGGQTYELQSASEHNVETACGGAIMNDGIKCIEIIIDHI